MSSSSENDETDKTLVASDDDKLDESNKPVGVCKKVVSRLNLLKKT